jgi:hypothetical protein
MNYNLTTADINYNIHFLGMIKITIMCILPDLLMPVSGIGDDERT